MSTNSHSQKVVIIGGGLLGLSLAYYLSEKNIGITILEKSNSLGGLAGGLTVNGAGLEKYYHHIFKSDTAIQSLMQELGLLDDLAWLPSKMGIYRDGQIYPFSHAFDILKFSPLNFFERLRLGLCSLYLQKIVKAEQLTGQTALNWCIKYFGKKVTAVIWEPLLKSKFGEDYDSIAMIWLWSRIKDRSSSRGLPWDDERLGYLNGGMQTLIDKLSATLTKRGVKIYTNAAILDFKAGGDEHALTWRNDKGIVSKARANKIVVAAAPQFFTDLFSPPEATVQKWEKIRFIGAICGVLVLKKSLIKDYWLSINEPSAPFVAVVEHTNLVGNKQFNGDYILYVGKYLKADDPQMHLSESQFWQVTDKFLNELNPDFSSDWVKERHIFKANTAQHLVTPEFEIPSYESGIKNVYFAHFAQIFPHDRGTNYAVAQARELANMLFKSKK
jgi:protoporphyrinogen oxidase